VIASAVASVVADGPAAGCRAIDVRAWGGLDVRLLPDRALDCGAAWFAGVPLAWISPVGETAVRGDWRASWGGGLVTTCGLRNVGAPSEGFGLHGDLSFQRAGWVGIERTDGEIVVRGTVADAELALEREWRVRAGTGTVSLRDVRRNTGTRTEPARVFEHEPAPGELTVVNERLGLAVTVRWEGLARLHPWVDPSLGALGIEPANCSVLGRAADRAAGRLPVLEPGEERVTALEIQAGSIS
jgi:hypothetical protein